jgi:hypothetical protein
MEWWYVVWRLITFLFALDFSLTSMLFLLRKSIDKKLFHLLGLIFLEGKEQEKTIEGKDPDRLSLSESLKGIQ